MPCGWEGNRRSGVALAMRHRLQWFIYLRAHGLDREMSTLSCGVWPSYPRRRARLCRCEFTAFETWLTGVRLCSAVHFLSHFVLPCSLHFCISVGLWHFAVLVILSLSGVVICLERGADLHMAQLMPLPLTVSCFSKIQIGFIFLVLSHPGNPGQRVINWVWSICVMLNLSLVRWQY